MLRKLICAAVIASSAYCGSNQLDGYMIPNVILDAVKNNECYKNRDGECNPNVIRINRSSDIDKAINNGVYAQGPHVICGTPDKCAEMAEFLIGIGITNIDLGPYQINYYWNGRHELSGYFVTETAEYRAREILRGLISKYGYSWTTLARYHNYDPNNLSRNRNYFVRMQKYVLSANNTQSKPEAAKPNDIHTQESIIKTGKVARVLGAPVSIKHEEAVIADTYPAAGSQNSYALKQDNARLWTSGTVTQSEKQFEERQPAQDTMTTSNDKNIEEDQS